MRRNSVIKCARLAIDYIHFIGVPPKKMDATVDCV